MNLVEYFFLLLLQISRRYVIASHFLKLLIPLLLVLDGCLRHTQPLFCFEGMVLVYCAYVWTHYFTVKHFQVVLVHVI